MSYLSYIVLVVLGFGVWVVFFLTMGKGKNKGKKHNLLGLYFVGPLHFYLQKRNYKLTTREIIGWGLVMLLMLLAPWITDILEK